MSIVTPWPIMLAASGRSVVATLLHSRRYKEKEAHKAKLDEWENEGGNAAPSPEASDSLVTTGSA